MLPATARLHRRDEFTAAVRTGRRAGRGSLVVHLASVAVGPTDPRHPADPRHLADREPPARVGFVVPRTVGNAVVRNRLRRRLRHLVRERLATLPAGSILVVRALPGAGDSGYHQLSADLDGALAAARAWSGR